MLTYSHELYKYRLNIYNEVLETKNIKIHNSLINEIKNVIDSNGYILIDCCNDVLYDNGNNDYLHELLITGYDDDSCEFSAVINDNKWLLKKFKYTKIELSFKKWFKNKNFSEYDNFRAFLDIKQYGLPLTALYKKPFKRNYNLYSIISDLENNLFGAGIKDKDTSFALGTTIYDIFENLLSGNSSQNEFWFAVRGLNKIYESKKGLHLKIHYMYDKYNSFIESDYDEKYNTLINTFDHFKSFFIKYFQTKKEIDRQKAVKYVKKVKQSDKEFLLASLEACYKEARQEIISLQNS